MRTLDAIAHILKKEGIEYLSAFPTTSVIESAADIGIRPIICRQERVGVGIADGYSRVTNGRPAGVFAMQYGPGAENAYAGIATAFSDAVPMLLLPLGHPSGRDGVYPHFSSVRSYESVTKNVERLQSAELVADTMRRAFALLKMGRPGPVMVEIPADIGDAEVPEGVLESYRPVKAAIAGADVRAVDEAAAALLSAENPVVYAGQGVMHAEATDDLVELAELLQIPGDDQHGRQERLSREASAIAWLGVRSNERRGLQVHRACRPRVRGRLQPDEARHDHDDSLR